MRTAVVTGAAGLIGAAICARLTDLGHQVVAVDIDTAGLDRLAVAHTVEVDLADPDAGEIVAAAVAERTGRCDVLVNNAGIVVTTPFEQATIPELLRELHVDLRAPIVVTRALFPLLQQAHGHVVSVGSLGGLMPLAQSPGYTAAKFGLRGFLLALAQREAETGVQISIVNPGSVDTPMLRHEAATDGSPLNFLGTPMAPDTVAQIVALRIRHPRLETNLPRHDGWLIKALMLSPGLAGRLRPLLGRWAGPNLETYRRMHGIRPTPTAEGEDRAVEP